MNLKDGRNDQEEQNEVKNKELFHMKEILHPYIIQGCCSYKVVGIEFGIIVIASAGGG